MAEEKESWVTPRNARLLVRLLILVLGLVAAGAVFALARAKNEVNELAARNDSILIANAGRDSLVDSLLFANLRRDSIVDLLRLVAAQRDTIIEKQKRAESRLKVSINILERDLEGAPTAADSTIVFQRIIVEKDSLNVVCEAKFNACQEKAFALDAMADSLSASRDAERQAREAEAESKTALADVNDELIKAKECKINLLITSIGCPSRGVVFLVGVGMGVVTYAILDQPEPAPVIVVD